MPQSRALSSYDTLRAGIDRISGKSPASPAAKKPTPDPEWTPAMEQAYQRRRASNYGKDINLPKAKR